MWKAWVKFHIFVIMAWLPAFAAESIIREDGAKASADPHHKGLLSSLNLGVRYSSVDETRGVIFYRDYQVDPVVGVFLFDDRLEYLGDSIGFRDFAVQDTLRLRTRFVSITDKPLFPSTYSVREGAPQRKDTYEWSNSAEIFLPGYDDSYCGELDLTWSQDIAASHGNYFEIQGKAKLFDFRIPKMNTKMEPNLFASLGWGDKLENQYLYGENINNDGINNYAFGLWFAFPEEADRFYPIIQVRKFAVLGDSKKGTFAIGRDEGWLVSFIATFGVLEK